MSASMRLLRRAAALALWGLMTQLARWAPRWMWRATRTSAQLRAGLRCRVAGRWLVWDRGPVTRATWSARLVVWAFGMGGDGVA